MALNGLERTLNRLRTVLAAELTDEQLLRAFLAERDEAAFAALVRRHGRMVLGVCRRVLGNLHDSEDVFQATFLVLAQKAPTVAKCEALPSWLYKVAYRISLKARARHARRRQKETQVDVMPQAAAPAPNLGDWEALLDEELYRLPEKYRLPVVLCDLEGRPRKEVERQLKVPAGTLSSRLTTARRMLAERLSRRGLALSVGALAGALSAPAAALPAGLATRTAQLAVLVAAGQVAALSQSVTMLMKTGVKAMFLTKLKVTAAILVVLGALGAGTLVQSSGGGGEPGSAKPLSEVERLRKENELLRINLRVTLEKIQALEGQLSGYKQREKAAATDKANWRLELGLRLDDPTQQAQRAADAQAKLAAEAAHLEELRARGQLKVQDQLKAAEAERARALQALRRAEDAAAEQAARAEEQARKARAGQRAVDDKAVEALAEWLAKGKQGESQAQTLGRALELLRKITEQNPSAAENRELIRRAAEALERLGKQLREQKK
jgi:RNA polymerase sigma factor (sigma-70 family)